MFFSKKTILEFFLLLYVNFILVHCIRKKVHINTNNLVRFCRNLALK